MRQPSFKFGTEIKNKLKNIISMKDSNLKLDNKAKVKELALEKLRRTEGGKSPITDLIKDIVIAGGIMGDSIKNILR